jgi:hypothetical protein
MKIRDENSQHVYARIAGVSLLAIILSAALSNNLLALLGAFRRVANAIVLAVGVVVGVLAVDALADAHYLTAFKTDQMQAIARQLLDIHGAAMLIGLILFGLGAATHSFLLVFPSLDPIIDPWFVAPDFVVELVVALWLIIKGVNIQALAPKSSAAYK